MSDYDPKGRAKEEAAGALVLILAGVLLQFTQRWASDPDAVRKVKMRAAKAAEKFCATTAGKWWELAERARSAYETERAG